MLAPLVAPLIALVLAAQTGELSAGERVPLVAVVLAPGGERTQLSLGAVLDAAALAIEPHSGVRVLSAEQAGAEAAAFVRCPPDVRLSCWLRAARAGRDADDPRVPGFVLVISVLARAGEPDRLTAILLDVEAAEAAAGRASSEDEVEDLIQIHAVRAMAGTIVIERVEDLPSWLDTLVTSTLRPAFAARGQWSPFGAARVETEAAVVVELDGRALGRIEPGTTLIRELRAGPRRFTFRPAAGAASAAQEVEIAAGEEASVQVVLPSSTAPVARTGSVIGGAIVAAAGVGLVVWAIAASPSQRALTPCVGAGCEGPAPERWDDACTLTHDDPASCGPSRGLLVAPLGGALILAGGTWLAGGFLGDPDEWPWIAWIAGAAVGALGYGIAAAAGP